MSEPVPGLEIAVSLEAGDWEARLPDPYGLVEGAARAAFAAAEPPGVLGEGAAEMSLVLADDALVRTLNRDYRDKDRPTNVLSFALLDDLDTLEGQDDDDVLATDAGMPILIGDVILAYETVLREAGEQGKSFENHLTHLVIHGVLHLLGYDHETDPDADRMERLETSILARLGIADPYADSSGGADGADGASKPQTT